MNKQGSTKELQQHREYKLTLIIITKKKSYKFQQKELTPKKYTIKFSGV